MCEIHGAVAGHLDRKTLFKAVAEALQRVSPAGTVILLLPDADPSALRVYAAHGKGGTKFFEGQSIPRDASMPGWVVQHRLPLIARRADEIRERFPTSYEMLRREGMESVAVVPLLAGGRCVGALGLMAEQAGAWDTVPERLLDEIAASVGVALDSSVNYEEVANLRDEQKAQLDINRAVARHLRRDELFAALARCLGAVMPYDRFGIELPVSGDRLRAHVLCPVGAKAPAQVEELPAAGTACRWVEQNRQWMVASTRDEMRERFPVTHQVMTRESMESLCAVPLVAGERCRGVLFFMKAGKGAYESLRRGLLEQVASAVAVALDNCLAYEEVQALRDRLAAENVYLQEEIRQDHNFQEIVGRSAVLHRALQDVVLVAPTDSTVLIRGETGTGKELVARAVHARSRRANRPLIKVNCAAIPAGLAESELFGHEKGAFTGATQRRIGRFELADGGTIFLDEVGELPPDVQVKLLRVRRGHQPRPGGGRPGRPVPPGPLLPARGLPPARAAPAPAPRRHPAAGPLLRAEARRPHRPQDRGRSRPRHAAAGRLRLAGQRARAGEPDRARGDPVPGPGARDRRRAGRSRSPAPARAPPHRGGPQRPTGRDFAPAGGAGPHHRHPAFHELGGRGTARRRRGPGPAPQHAAQPTKEARHPPQHR